MDDVWAASPATNDTQWAQANAADVNKGNSTNKSRTLLYSGSATNITVDLPVTSGQIYIEFGWGSNSYPTTQTTADIETALNKGHIRFYRRGGEQADREYDAKFDLSRSGNRLNIVSKPASRSGQSALINSVIVYE